MATSLKPRRIDELVFVLKFHGLVILTTFVCISTWKSHSLIVIAHLKTDRSAIDSSSDICLVFSSRRLPNNSVKSFSRNYDSCPSSFHIYNNRTVFRSQSCFSPQRRRGPTSSSLCLSSSNLFALYHRSTSASLPSQSFWGKFKPKNKEDMRDRQAQMALARQRLLTMAFGDMETIRMVSPPTLRSVTRP